MAKSVSGGCACGSVRYEVKGDPEFAGLCYCLDCQKASGSAFTPFACYKAANMSVTIRGTPLPGKPSYPPRESAEAPATGPYSTQGRDMLQEVKGMSVRCEEKVITRCTSCGSLLFGGRWSLEDDYNIYAGSMDDSNNFEPKIAIFVKDRPKWAEVRKELKEFDIMPGFESKA